MSVLDTVLSGLDATTVIIFLLVFLIGYYGLTTPRNLPPGPIGLPVVGNLTSLMTAGPNILDLMKKWRQQYGDVFTVRVGKEYMVVISSHQILHDAFVKQGDVFSGRPTHLYTAKVINEETGTGISLMNGHGWRELRRMTMSSMKDFGMGKKSLEHHIRDEARAVREILEKGQGQPVFFKPLMGKFAANILCYMVFGNRHDYDDTFLIKLTEMACRSNDHEGLMTVLNFLPFLAFIPSLKREIANSVKAILAVSDLLETTLRYHEETYDPAEVRDFVDLYIKTREETKDSRLFSEKNLRRMILDLLIAGVDTTSIVLDWILLHLVANPEVQRRCQEDVDRVIGQGRLVTMEDRKDLPYIQAVISETLRLETIGPLGLPHMTEGEAELAGYTIPAKTIIVGNIHEIHHDPDLWPEPYVFNPGRFLDRGGQFCPSKDGYIPFSTGPRICLGESLARMELFVMLTTLVQSFTFTMAQGQKPDLEGHLGLLYTAKPQPVFATRR